MSFSNFSNGFSKSRRLATFLNRGIEENNITFDGRFIVDSADVTTLVDSDYVRLHTRIGDSDIDFGQNNKALFGGTGGDLEIYHDGTNAYIDNNDGQLYIRNNVDGDDGGDIRIQAKAGENGIIVQDDGNVALYYDGGGPKLYTQSTGAGITGFLDVSGHVEAIGVEETVYDLGTTGGTITPNFTNGAIQKITLNNNLTFSAFTSPVAGQSITLIIDTNGTGRTLTSTMLFAGGNKTMSTTDTTDVMTVLYDGANYLANYVTDFS